MEITIEVGTEEQKRVISEELSFIPELCLQLEDPPEITGIWVPRDFDTTVNSLQGTTHYVSLREHHAIAKNVIQPHGTALVFSPLLFTEAYDNHIRMQIYLHEFWHTINKNRFPDIAQNSLANHEYEQNLYILFDEYSANRKSFELTEKIFQITSKRYKQFTRNSATGFLRDIIDSEKHYQHILKEINKFRFHGDVSEFLKGTRESFDTIAKSLEYFFSYTHHYCKFEKLNKFIETSRFIDEEALSLIEFFKEKHENGEYDLTGGIEWLRKFMEKFGVRFEDKNEGLYCHIIDI